MDAWMTSLLQTLALPEFGLSTVFVVAFVSATLNAPNSMGPPCSASSLAVPPVEIRPTPRAC
ncbi:MAG: hypothetical protein ACKOFG_02125, partial [Limnohabitans sp.]